MSEDLGHIIIAPTASWGRYTRWWKWLVLGRTITKLPADQYYITVVIKEEVGHEDA